MIPLFSVVVASHRRPLQLARLLDSLDRSRAAKASGVEVVVVDSTAADESAAIRDACAKVGAKLIAGPLGVRRKRNIGARAATAGWLLFVDSDCEVSPVLFDAYLQALARDPQIRAAAGPTVFRGGKTAFTRLIEASSLFAPFRQPASPGLLLWATTSNLLVRRDVFDALGGFREDFPFRLGGDDTDFCFRLRAAGYGIVAVPAAVSFHSWTTWSAPSSVVRRSFRWGWMHSRLLRDHVLYRRLDSPGLAVHALACCAIALAGATMGSLRLLLTPMLFAGLAIGLHALFACLPAPNRGRAFLADLALALVELPFGFGRALGSLVNGSLVGVLYRLDSDDAAMNAAFPETVRSLWSDHLAFLITACAAGWAT